MTLTWILAQPSCWVYSRQSSGLSICRRICMHHGPLPCFESFLWVVFNSSNVSCVVQRFPCFKNVCTMSVENRETESQWKGEKTKNPVLGWQPKTRTKQIQLNTWESSQTVWLCGCLMTVKMALRIPKKQHFKVLWKSIVLTLQTIRLINVTKGLKLT